MAEELWASLSILDRQLVDKDGRPCGNADDLEFELPVDGEELPILVGILVGAGPLGRRLGHAFGDMVESLHQRLHPRERGVPPKIPMGVVKKIGSHIDLTIDVTQAGVHRFEEWAADHIIGRIPFAKKPKKMDEASQLEHEKETP